MKHSILALLAAATVSACAATTDGSGPGEWRSAVMQDKIDVNKRSLVALNGNEKEWPYADINYIGVGCSSDVGFYFNIKTHNFLNDEGTTRYEVRVDGYDPIRGRGMSLRDGVFIRGANAKLVAKQIASVPQNSYIHIRVYAWDGEISSDSMHVYDHNGSVNLTMQRCNVS